MSQVWTSEDIIFEYNEPKARNFLKILLTVEEVLCFVLLNDQTLFEETELPMDLLFTTLKHGVKLGTGLNWPEMEPNVQR